jgi:hypothetical protein
MYTDPIVEELHRHRRELMARFDNNPDAFFAYIKEQERLSSTPLIQLPRPEAPPPNPARHRTRH